MNRHKQITDDAEYEVTLHPGFASECTVTSKSNNASRRLYRQTETYICGDEGHPTQHQIVVREKGEGGRTLTITIDDPSHILHGISLDLYEAGRDPRRNGTWKSKDTVTVLNTANTCPPNCIE